MKKIDKHIQGYGEELFFMFDSSQPESSSETVFTLDFLELFLIKDDFEFSKKIDSFIKPIDVTKLSVDDSDFLFVLIKKGYADKLFQKIKTVVINLATLSEGGSIFLAQLAHVGYGTKIFERVEAVDLINLSNAGEELLLELVDVMGGGQILEKIAAIDLFRLSSSSFLLLENLVYEGFSDQLLAKIIRVEAIYLSRFDINIYKFLFALTTKKNECWLFYKIKINGLDPAKLDSYGIWFLDFLRNFYSDYEFAEIIEVDDIDLTQLTGSMADFLLKIYSQDRIDKLFQKIKVINLTQLSGGGNVLLQTLFRSDCCSVEIFEKISNINLSLQLSKFAISLLKHMAINHSQVLFEKIGIIDLTRLNGSAIKFILFLIDSGHIEKVLEKIKDETVNEKNILEKIESYSNIRREFNKADLSDFLDKDVDWPSINKQILKIPVSLETIRKLKGGWYSVKLQKDGGDLFVYVRMSGKKLTNVIFRNKNINKLSMDAYKKALEVLPEYVSTAVYPELIEQDKSLSKIYLGGFREVYAGPSIRSLHLNLSSQNLKFPQMIKEEILRQKKYIIRSLKKHGINYKQPNSPHLHDGNFNVRFLLKDDDGFKYVSFDINEAFNMMKENSSLTLTPIVILRDWDEGSVEVKI